MANEITVIDYGVGNLFSVRKALEHCGASVKLVSDPEALRLASRVILPGVGAFGDGMALLAEHGMDEAVKEYAVRGGALLGVCLGMQLLLDTSEEFGLGHGLGLIPGKVIPIPEFSADGVRNKIPHIGWNSLVAPSGKSSWNSTILETTELNSAMYFVHSYMAMPGNPAHRVADCIYGDTHIAAVIGRDNVWGAQFHPEKSGPAGLAILQEFVRR